MMTALLAAAALNPVEFFDGRTHGDGTLKIIFQQPRRIKVDSLGRRTKDGSLMLRQMIREPGKAPRRRFWRFRQTGPTRFQGTLSDAAGPVRIDQVGPRIRIRYTDRKNLDFEQWLTPAGPHQVNNAMRVKRFGITVARFNEIIRKLD